MAVRQVTEERRSDAPLFVHPEWQQAFPWVTHGITSREAGNFSRASEQTMPEFDRRWTALRAWLRTPAAVIGRQVHGASVLVHGETPPGLLLAEEADGHVTGARGVLLGVSVADCVPVFVVDPLARYVAVLHAGWRGVAAGILRTCLEMMGNKVHVHLGPAICGRCYEIGPEVHAALGLGGVAGRMTVDLRTVLANQCVALGVPSDNITRSSHCTRCGETPFYSHRGGDAERQIAVIGIERQ